MSFIKSSTNIAKNDALNIRRKSTIALAKDFESTYTPMGEYYDYRIYTDSHGEQFTPWIFSKSLLHDSTTGFPKKDDVDTIINAIDKGTEESLNNIQQNTVAVRKLENVIGQKSYNLIGTDSSVPVVTKPKTRNEVDSVAGLFELAEVYSSVILRDVSFANISSESMADNVPNHLTALNKFTDKSLAPVDINSMIITGKTWNRGNCIGETVGPYISQYFYLDYQFGNLDITQKYTVELDPEPTPTLAHWLKVQNGENPLSITVDANKQYVWNPRVLASVVHNDPMYQFYYIAALISFQNGISFAGITDTKSSAWTSTGPPDILASVAHVALGALRVAWQAKYTHSLKIRPEVYAQRIDLIKSNPNDFADVPGFSNLKTLCDSYPEMLNLVKTNNNEQNWLINCLYPEMSPVHPSHPAGHAVVGWACCTVLKAMLDTHELNGDLKKWPIQPKHSINGNELVDYTHADKESMTIVGELNKLANNAGMGRNFAGIHFRADATYGAELGEQYAITYLVDKAKEYHESYNGQFTGFMLSKCNGDTIKITMKGVENL
tara:strand:- start:11481 stop:13133 length:1653 start_codon:yes stop_codon:yes gene_type:complete